MRMADKNWEEMSPAICVFPPGKPLAMILMGGQILEL